MTRNLKIILLTVLAIAFSINILAQTKEDKADKHITRKDRNQLTSRSDEYDIIPEPEEIKDPCSDFQDNKDFLYSTGKGQGHNFNMAMQNAIHIAQSELKKKIISDECYKDIWQQGVSLNISEVCKQMAMNKEGMCICYVAICVARKDLEKPNNPNEEQSRQHEATMKHIQQIINTETDSIDVLQKK